LRLLYAFPEPLPLPRARGVQVANAVRSLAQAGVEVDLAYVPVLGRSPFEGVDVERSVQLVPVSRAWPAPLDRVPPFSRWHSVRFFVHRLLGEIGRRRPDLLYVRHLKLAASLLTGRPHLPPLVYEAHEVFFDTVAAKRRERTLTLERTVIQKAAAVVCNSRATAERLTALYGVPRHLLVLPNGVTPLASLPEKPWHECRRHVVYAGSFFAWKGVADLVAAAASLEGFRLTLIGGEQEQIARLPWPVAGGAEVEFLPRLPHAQVMARMAASCIAVLPNRPDPDSAFTSPIKLFEYMAAGCAIVTSDLPAIREILGDDDAAWFEAGNSASLRKVLAELGEDCCRARKLGERAYLMSEAYGWNRRAARLKAFLERLPAG